MSEDEKWLKGKLLLDGGVLHGSFFHHTVVLVCEHNAEGAFGLVLNRAAGNKVGEVLVANLPIHSTIWWKSVNPFRRRKRSRCSRVTPAGRPASLKWK
ncbi:MAG: YqgE/AlgH family protein [Verrucomicrobiota bacterium]